MQEIKIGFEIMTEQNTRHRAREGYQSNKKQYQNTLQEKDVNRDTSYQDKKHREKNYQDKKRFSNKKNYQDKKYSEQKTPVLPGLKPVLELLQSDCGKIDQIFLRKGRTPKDSNMILDLCREKGVRFSLVDEHILAQLCEAKDGQNVQHQGIVARLRTMSYISAEELFEQAFDAPLPLIVILDQVLDPGNVGTLVRTLYALGVAGLIVPRHNSAFLGAGAQRSSAGALEKLPIAEVVNLARTVELAAKSGFTTYAADLDGINVLANESFLEEEKNAQNTAIPLLQLPAVLVLGSEEKGVRQGILKHCEHKLTIPFLRAFDSLNVAQAGAILASCFLRAHTLK